MAQSCAIASVLINDGAGLRPRPRGRSGCVTTATTSCDEANRPRNVGSAKGAVPMKITRIGCLPLDTKPSRILQHQPLEQPPSSGVMGSPHKSSRNSSTLNPAALTITPIVIALTGLCLGIVNTRTPSVITMLTLAQNAETGLFQSPHRIQMVNPGTLGIARQPPRFPGLLHPR